jgi:hypothetical protein
MIQPRPNRLPQISAVKLIASVRRFPIAAAGNAKPMSIETPLNVERRMAIRSSSAAMLRTAWSRSESVDPARLSIPAQNAVA